MKHHVSAQYPNADRRLRLRHHHRRLDRRRRQIRRRRRLRRQTRHLRPGSLRHRRAQRPRWLDFLGHVWTEDWPHALTTRFRWRYHARSGLPCRPSCCDPLSWRDLLLWRGHLLWHDRLTWHDRLFGTIGTAAIAGTCAVLSSIQRLLAVAAAVIHPVAGAGPQVIVAEFLLDAGVVVSHALAVRRIVLPITTNLVGAVDEEVVVAPVAAAAPVIAPAAQRKARTEG